MLRTLLVSFTLSTAALAFAVPVDAADFGPRAEAVKKKRKKKTQTGIRWVVSPDTVQIFVDNDRKGVAKNLKVTTTKPGVRTVRLVNGEDEAEFEVNVAKGQVVELRYEFTDG